MALVKISEILKKAKDEKYAVGAFNADNLEMVQSFIAASEKMRSALIIQVSLGAINYSGLGSVVNIALYEARSASVPVAVHLDHITDFDHNVLALRAGVGSLGVDAAALSFSDNLSLSKQVCSLAHIAGLDAEAGIGYVPDVNENYSPSEINDHKTKINEAIKFVEETKVDLLAVAVGSMRGMGERKIDLDISLLQQINHRLNIPLVLHGASGVKWDSIKEAIKNGICKVNISSTFDQRFLNAIRYELSQRPKEINFRSIFKIAKQAVEDEVCEIIKKLGSNNKY
ncbi:MAG: tagatose-bisphosphate aldolase subunit KbaY [Anaerolineaceae bacterium]|jgi:fructose-bisphosphate aldolase class II|nr:MAG: tagatose-bisphosphate aldolase subunit KbaY [Anaerolineaceae bacterium]